MAWTPDLGDVAVLQRLVPTFYAQQSGRLAELGIGVAHYPVSHIAVRVPTWREYVAARSRLESAAVANLENVWNGRPISKIVLADPIPVGQHTVELVELIPPFHQRVYAMGLEHIGFVVDDLEAFVDTHLDVLTGRQFQTRSCTPAYRLFSDYTHVKFYARSLRAECELEGASFEGFVHADWTVTDDLRGPYEV